MNQKTRWIACLAAGLCGLMGLNTKGADLTGSYTWKPLKVGGGGWVVGMDYQTSTGLIYARADVSGAYRWNGPWGNNNWTQLVTSSSMPVAYQTAGSYQGVDSICAGTNVTSSVYMAYQGQIFRSWNNGSTWNETTFKSTNTVQMLPNGNARRCGERLGVDPANDNNAYYCPINDYLYHCPVYNGTWSTVTAIPKGTANYGVTTVKFDPTSGTTFGNTNVVYVTVMNGGVWRSANAGVSWTNIATLTGGPGNSTGANHSVVGPDGTYYVCCGRDASATSGIWKYVPSTSTWTNISPSTNTTDYQGIAVDPTNANRITVMKQGGSAWTSTNQGASWTTQTWDRASSTVTWLSGQTDHWMSVGALIYDPLSAGKLWFAEGFGVWNTTDIADTNITWTERAAGIEETCANTVVAPTVDPLVAASGKPVTAMWDIGTFYHSNPDLYNAARGRSTFCAAWDLDWCAGTPSFIAAVRQDNLGNHPPVYDSGYSTDGGQTWTRFAGLGAGGTATAFGSKFGHIAVSATNVNHIVWCPAGVGNPNVSTLPYYTADKGATWNMSSFGATTDLGVPAYNIRIHPLAADRVLADTFYLYATRDNGASTAGFYRSTDGGANWTKVATPASWAYYATVKATPGIASDVWWGGGYSSGYGLFHSTNGGTSWTAVSGVTQALAFGFGKTAVGSTYPTIFVAGTVSGVSGIFRSTNGGSSWDKVGTVPLGIYDIIDSMDGDKTTFGKVYLSFYYSGFAYGATSGP